METNQIIEYLNPNDDQKRMLLDLPPKKGRYKQTVDLNGNTLWFYWIKIKNPLKKWKRWERKLQSIDINLVNKKNEHILYKIILEGNIELWNWFNNKYSNIIIDKANIWGENEIHAAVWANNIEMLKYYIDRNVNLDLRNKDGITPIMIATNKNLEIARMLLLAGADPNISDNKNKNALHYAAETLDTEMYVLIEDCGGDYKQKDILGRVPEDIYNKTLEKSNREIEANINYWIKQYEKRKEL
ncbi:TPA: ankyrin repeat domain-containing protein [Escherichia coli]|nr:ankyrin repeat domain-containing protein [Escherichia coli]